jgi:prepilin peptidase CpaA
MSTLPLTIKFALALIVASAATYDFRYRKIPNWLNLSGLILGFGLNISLAGSSGFLSAGEGLLLAFSIYLPLYLLKGMGAGDVKLMAAIGSLVGPSTWFEIFLATALFGGLAAAVLALTKERFNETCWNVFCILHDLSHFRSPYRSNAQLDIRNARSLRMPHGVTIAIGCAAAFILSSSASLKLLP